MAEGADQEDKTEDPSDRRIERARDEGQVALSPELPALAVLTGSAVILAMAAPDIGRTLVRRLEVLVAQAHALSPATAVREALVTAAAAVLPFLAIAIACAAAATLLQTGFLLHLKAAMPDIARISPRRGLGRVFGLTTLVTAAKSVLKVAVVGTAGWMVLRDALPQLASAANWDAMMLTSRTAAVLLRVMIAMLIAQALIAVGDILLTRIRHHRSLRMTKQELRDEHKEMEGDPLIKARLRRVRSQRARRRMLAAVPKATVVITNPTHYAVALAYSRDGDAAPRIVAKGVDSMAARIRNVAAEHRVPIVANPALARALYTHEIDRAIPDEFFAPVAEIIAYVWRLRGRVQ